jgi:hypothetical protein
LPTLEKMISSLKPGERVSFDVNARGWLTVTFANSERYTQKVHDSSFKLARYDGILAETVNYLKVKVYEQTPRESVPFNQS